MNPARIEGDAVPLGKPQDWQDDENGHCSTLWVRHDLDRGVSFLRSAWEVEADEAGWMLAGAKLQLGIAGTAHPVVNLGLGPIPEDFTPPLTVQRMVTPSGFAAVRVVMYLPNKMRVHADALLGSDGLAPAVSLAIVEIEALCRREGWPA
jgi:hypothetical protein